MPISMKNRVIFLSWKIALCCIVAIFSIVPLRAAPVITDQSLNLTFSENSVLWKSDVQTISKDHIFYPHPSSPTSAPLVIQTDNTGFANVLPITLLDEVALNITGRLVIENKTTTDVMEWRNDDPLSQSTGQILASVRAKDGDVLHISGEIRVVLICKQTPCVSLTRNWGLNNTLAIPNLYLSIKDYHWSKIETLLASSNIKLNAACQVDISPTKISFGTVTPKAQGIKLAERKTMVNAVCRSGLISLGEYQRINIQLIPDFQHDSKTAGVRGLDGQSVDGLGIRYCAGRCWGDDEYSQTKTLMSLGNWIDWGYDEKMGSAAIKWTLYQRQPSVRAGYFTSKIRYILSID